MSSSSPMEREKTYLWVDPGVTTGIVRYRRGDSPEFIEIKGLGFTLERLDQMLRADTGLIGYESFYIAERSTKASINNIRAATHLIGWLEGEAALGNLVGWELVNQAPVARLPRIITPYGVAEVLGGAPKNMPHALDAARHLVTWLVHREKDEEAKERYAHALQGDR